MANCKDCLKQDVCNRDVGHGYFVCPCYLSADVEEVKHGEWNIGEFNKIRQVVVVECSECECVLELPMSSWGLNYHYCPNCGAKMGKGDSE